MVNHAVYDILQGDKNKQLSAKKYTIEYQEYENTKSEIYEKELYELYK